MYLIIFKGTIPLFCLVLRVPSLFGYSRIPFMGYIYVAHKRYPRIPKKARRAKAQYSVCRAILGAPFSGLNGAEKCLYMYHQLVEHFSDANTPKLLVADLSAPETWLKKNAKLSRNLSQVSFDNPGVGV